LRYTTLFRSDREPLRLQVKTLIRGREIEAAHPDVPEAHGLLVTVVLDRDRAFLDLPAVFRPLPPHGLPVDLPVVLDDDAVVEDRQTPGLDHLVALPSRATKDDVVDLPLARGSRGVGERRLLAVDRAHVAIGVGRSEEHTS